MALLGAAALAMWWDMAPHMRDEFQHWHSHEHFPERVAIPGFMRASRWADADGGNGFFVLYEVRGFDVLTSPAYLAHLNSPTPWSTKLMPHHRNMVRSQCEVIASCGAALAGHALTLRFSAADLQSPPASDAAAQVLGELAGRPGVTGAHLLHAREPAIARTVEQKIRGNDGIADWVVVLCGYDRQALQAAAADASRALAAGASGVTAHHVLAASATAGEL